MPEQIGEPFEPDFHRRLKRECAFRRWKYRIAFAVFIIFLLLILLALFLSQFLNWQISRGPSTVGAVLKLTRTTSYATETRDTHYYVTYRYRVNGEQFYSEEEISGSDFRNLKKGDPLSIQYANDIPSLSRSAVALSPSRKIIGSFVAVSLLVLVTLYLRLRNRRATRQDARLISTLRLENSSPRQIAASLYLASKDLGAIRKSFAPSLYGLRSFETPFEEKLLQENLWLASAWDWQVTQESPWDFDGYLERLEYGTRVVYLSGDEVEPYPLVPANQLAEGETVYQTVNMWLDLVLFKSESLPDIWESVKDKRETSKNERSRRRTQAAARAVTLSHKYEDSGGVNRVSLDLNGFSPVPSLAFAEERCCLVNRRSIFGVRIGDDNKDAMRILEKRGALKTFPPQYSLTAYAGNEAIELDKLSVPEVLRTISEFLFLFYRKPWRIHEPVSNAVIELPDARNNRVRLQLNYIPGELLRVDKTAAL